MNYLTLLVLAYLAALLWFGIRGGTRERELNAFLTGRRIGRRASLRLLACEYDHRRLSHARHGRTRSEGRPGGFLVAGRRRYRTFLHGLIIAPVVRKLPVVTLPDVLRHLAGPAAEKWAGAISRSLGQR